MIWLDAIFRCQRHLTAEKETKSRNGVAASQTFVPPSDKKRQPTGQPHFPDGNPRILAGRTHRNVWLSLLNERFFINSHPVMSRRLLREKNDYSWSRSKKRSILYQEKGRIASLCFVMTCCVNFVPAAIGEMSLLPKKLPRHRLISS